MTDLEIISATDIDMCCKYDESAWNGWRREGNTLGYPEYRNGGMYPVDLERFTASSVVLDFIMQVAGKSWATDKCLAGLVRALDDILDPQANLCSGGGDRRLATARLQQILRQRRTG
jgi:hypothetical protein